MTGPRLSAALCSELRRLAEIAYPREACGLLAGRGGVARAALPARNLASAGDRFLLDPLAWPSAAITARGLGLSILGVWHSHPDAPPRPSSADTDGAAALPLDWHYVIVGVGRGRAGRVLAYSVAAVRGTPGCSGLGRGPVGLTCTFTS